jgi:hypothetical protein
MRARAVEQGVEIEECDEEMDYGEQDEGVEDTGGGNDDDNDDVSLVFVHVRRMILTLQQSFTIGMMLKSMNIDLDLIGYCMEREMWIA